MTEQDFLDSIEVYLPTGEGYLFENAIPVPVWDHRIPDSLRELLVDHIAQLWIRWSYGRSQHYGEYGYMEHDGAIYPWRVKPFVSQEEMEDAQ